MKRVEIPIGSKFGLWTVIGNPVTYKRKTIYRCRCACGKERDVYACHLRSGQSQACGCVAAKKSGDRTRTHGMTLTREYRVWRAMIDRCHYPSNKAYPRYGGRGIFVCDKWRNSFENFFADMGKRPSDGHSIDRIKNDIGYEPGNCRWATATEQARNRRKEKATASGVAGVHLTPHGNWIARIGSGYQVVNLGTFKNLSDAVDARKRAEKELWQTA